MKYCFTVEIYAEDRPNVRATFDADNARDIRSAWQGVSCLLSDLEKSNIIVTYKIEATKATVEAWERGGLI